MILEMLAPIIGNVLDRVLPGESSEITKQKLTLQAEILKAAAEQDIQQLEVNKVEAAAPSLFVSGWRPFIGWCCGLGFAYVTLLQPILSWFSMFMGWPLPPVIGSDLFLSVMMGMLGLGGLRSFEKFKNITKK